ncbi:MAG: hypothetical protein KAI24_08680 [Planctomycetes bacterium]|nr:hypothetical protein [Planctomycetota bacterium]
MSIRTLLAALAVVAATATATAQGRKAPDTTSKQPPAGAPWTKDFAAAHRLARATGKPIFVYSTKTY